MTDLIDARTPTSKEHTMDTDARINALQQQLDASLKRSEGLQRELAAALDMVDMMEERWRKERDAHDQYRRETQGPSNTTPTVQVTHRPDCHGVTLWLGDTNPVQVDDTVEDGALQELIESPVQRRVIAARLRAISDQINPPRFTL